MIFQGSLIYWKSGKVKFLVKIKIKSPCSASEIIKYGIKNWPIWECEPSKFSWSYNEKEICLIIEGEASIYMSEGKLIYLKSGDLVEFPKGLKCEWQITKKIKKHFRLGD